MPVIGTTRVTPGTLVAPKTYSVRNETTHEILDIIRWEIERLTERAVDKATIMVKKDTNVSVGSEIKIFTKTGTTLFGGNVVEIKKRGMWELVVMGYGYELNNKFKTKVYTSTTPEAIVSDIITSDTDLTFSSSDTSGVTIDKYIANDYLYKIIEEMRALLGWQVRTEPDKKFYFEPEGNTDNNVTWITGTHISVQEWLEDPNQQVNKVKVKGDFANYFKNETFTATASQTDFTLSFKPVGVVKVFVDSVEKTGGAPGKGDFDVNGQEKKIEFATPMTGGESVVIDYSYQIPIVVQAEDSASITTHGEIFKEIQGPHLKSFAEARLFAKEYVAKHKDPALSAKVIRRNIDTTLGTGDIVTIQDGQRDITEQLVVKKINWIYPEGVTRIEVGSIATDISDWQAEVGERIKTLEAKLADEQTVTDIKAFDHNLSVSLSLSGTVSTRAINDSMIWGHATAANGKWGTAKWGDRRGAKTTATTF